MSYVIHLAKFSLLGICMAALLLSTRAAAQISQVKIMAGKPAYNDYFGTAVAIGDKIIVGSPGPSPSRPVPPGRASTASRTAECAYIFSNGESGWQQESELRPDAPQAKEWFGGSVGIAQTVCIVGAPFFDAETDSGAVYFFRYDPSKKVWYQVCILCKDHAPEANAKFGYSVAMASDNLAIVGEPWRDSGRNTDEGVAHILRADASGKWSIASKLNSPSHTEIGFFGFSVGIQRTASGEELAIVGAPGITNVGAAYIFRYNGSSWVLVASLSASHPTAGARFGASVHISSDGRRAIVGAPREQSLDGKTHPGAAYIFCSNDGINWDAGTRIENPEPNNTDKLWDLFGYSVWIDGSNALVGAPSHRENSITVGAVYHFSLKDGHWEMSHELLAQDGAGDDGFGWSVKANTNNVAVVGALSKPIKENLGAAYIFTAPDPPDPPDPVEPPIETVAASCNKCGATGFEFLLALILYYYVFIKFKKNSESYQQRS